MTKGGCLCGALRYQVEVEPLDTGYCHCELCRKSTGAPLLMWATFPDASFRYSAGAPTIYRSSEWGQREFCGTCGTQVCYRDTRSAESVDVNVGSLDEPAAISPRCHIFTGAQLPWLSIDDDLPRYEGAGPNSPSD
jgi:hypothetical protein